MKNLLNISGRLLAAFPFLISPLLKLKKSGLRIVYYHTVGLEKRPYYFDDKGVSLKNFKRQLRFLKSHYRHITIADALVKWQNGESLNGFFAITTDDGFRENYTVIAPILKEHHLSATFYLISNCIDNKDLMWRNKLIYILRSTSPKLQKELADECAALFHADAIKQGEDLLQWSTRTWEMRWKEEAVNWLWGNAGIQDLSTFLEVHKPYLSSGEVKDLESQGFGFGIHSKTHPYFSKLGKEEAVREILDCANFLQGDLGLDCSTFSYPFGSRARPEVEKALVENQAHRVKALIGVKSNLRNGGSPMRWERDLLELNYFESISRFVFVPLARNLGFLKTS